MIRIRCLISHDWVFGLEKIFTNIHYDTRFCKRCYRKQIKILVDHHDEIWEDFKLTKDQLRYKNLKDLDIC